MGSLFCVRILVCAAILGLATCGIAQKLSGAYQVKGSDPVPWSINPHQTLIWGGSPYLPIGLQVEGSAAAIEAAKGSGIEDVIVDLPVGEGGWQPSIEALERLDMRYLIRFSSLAPMAKGIAVDPSSYRITDAKGVQHLDLALPGASEALVVAAQKRDGALIKWATLPVKNGRLIYDLTIPSELESVILIYPTESSLEQPDFWEGLDAQRDHMLQTLKNNHTGAGLRGFVNPLGKTLVLPNRDLKIIPQSNGFRAELASYLEIKYRNVVGVLRAWGMPSDIISTNEIGEDKSALLTFEDLARLVPLWSGSRGIGQIYDPGKKILYAADNLHSSIWKDLADTVSLAESRRYQRIVAAIREIDNVPVVQEWEGWAVPYEGESGSVDGIGMRATGTSPNAILSTAARATSSDLRWGKPGWLPATDIDVNSPDAATQIAGVTEDLIGVGARGVFFRTSSSEAIKSVSAEATRRKSDSSPSQISPNPIFFPENATNPAQVQKLPGGYWWLPAPYDGDRIDYGAGFDAYRMATPKGVTFTIWSDRPARVLLRMVDGKKFVASDLSGVRPDPKIVKGGVEVNLTDTPLVISGINEIPVPDPAYFQTLGELAVLIQQEKTAHKDLTEATMELEDARQGFDRNPGGQFLQLRKLLHQLDGFLGRFSWTETELSIDTNFSEVSDYSGCSNNRILRLHPMITPSTGFYAVYEIPVHTPQDQDLWLAARISPEDRALVTVDISGQRMGLNEPPVGLYGSGFGWYHIGTTKNAVGSARVKILVSGTRPELDTDAMLLAPVGYTPRGLMFPEIAVDLNDIKLKKRPKGRSGR